METAGPPPWRLHDTRHPAWSHPSMGLIIRLLLFLVITTIGVSLTAYVFTRDRKYLKFAWNTFRFTLMFLLALGVMLMLERALTT